MYKRQYQSKGHPSRWGQSHALHGQLLIRGGQLLQRLAEPTQGVRPPEHPRVPFRSRRHASSAWCLEQLATAGEAVTVMQQEIIELQPELVKAKAETEEMQIVIDKEVKEVIEPKKEVVSKEEAAVGKVRTSLHRPAYP